MSSIVVNNILEAIHFILKKNEFDISDKIIEKMDNEILPYLEEVDIDESEFSVLKPGVPVLAYDKRIYPIVVRYFAMTQNNLGLYEELVKNNYDFYGTQKINFHALDSVLTDKFRNGEYVKLLEKYDEVIAKFYSTLRGLTRKEKEKYCEDFSYVVHKDQSTLRVGKKEEENHSFYNFLVKRNFNCFGRDYLLGLDKDRREALNKIIVHSGDEIVEPIKELIEKYPHYNGNMHLSTDVLSYFTIDEIANMNSKDVVLYEAAIDNDLVKRVKGILDKDPLFDCSSSFIRQEIFRILDDDTIIGLSEDAKHKIVSIIPNFDNVIVMPIKKIKKIVFMDSIHKKVDDIKGSIK